LCWAAASSSSEIAETDLQICSNRVSLIDCAPFLALIGLNEVLAARSVTLAGDDPALTTKPAEAYTRIPSSSRQNDTDHFQRASMVIFLGG
jgi:hypothetical protein